jgi:predicted RNase H-like HicB family nuclease
LRPSTFPQGAEFWCQGKSASYHIPYVVEQDKDGAWRASPLLRPGVRAVGDGATPEEAITELRAALETLLEVVGPPSELTLTDNSA